jgi:hypothetical protein
LCIGKTEFLVAYELEKNTQHIKMIRRKVYIRIRPMTTSSSSGDHHHHLLLLLLRDPILASPNLRPASSSTTHPPTTFGRLPPPPPPTFDDLGKISNNKPAKFLWP